MAEKVREILVRLQKDPNYLKILRESYGKGSALLPVPVENQRRLLGLDNKVVAELSGVRFLDIGCGKGGLVKFLRKKGVEAEGIDSSVKVNFSLKKYFIKQNITGRYPSKGSIPRPDNFYQMIVTFQVGNLNDAFTVGGILRDPRQRKGASSKDIMGYSEAVESGKNAIFEGVRVLAPGGKFVIYPELSRLEEVIGPKLEAIGVTFKSEEVNHQEAKDYMWHEVPYEFPEEYFERMGLYSRTVIEKAR